MPTPFAMVLLAVLVIAAVAGLVLWARKASRARHTLARRAPGGTPGGTSREAPWVENTAAAQVTRQSDRGGWQ